MIPEGIAPDGITPEVGWRSWGVLRGYLCSLNTSTLWPVRAPLEAICPNPPRMHWVPRRYGRVVPQGMAKEGIAQAGGHSVVFQRVFAFEMGGLGPLEKEPPPVQLPAGFGYELEPLPKEIPDPHCSCGIYAMASKEDFFRSPYLTYDKPAIGCVSLWGKIVPGETGYRAQFAYPLFIYTDEEVQDYGVPVSPMKDLNLESASFLPKKKRR